MRIPGTSENHPPRCIFRYVSFVTEIERLAPARSNRRRRAGPSRPFTLHYADLPPVVSSGHGRAALSLPAGGPRGHPHDGRVQPGGNLHAELRRGGECWWIFLRSRRFSRRKFARVDPGLNSCSDVARFGGCVFLFFFCCHLPQKASRNTGRKEPIESSGLLVVRGVVSGAPFMPGTVARCEAISSIPFHSPPPVRFECAVSPGPIESQRGPRYSPDAFPPVLSDRVSFSCLFAPPPVRAIAAKTQSGPLASYGTLLTDSSGARSYVWSKVLGVYQDAAQKGRARGKGWAAFGDGVSESAGSRRRLMVASTIDGVENRQGVDNSITHFMWRVWREKERETRSRVCFRRSAVLFLRNGRRVPSVLARAHRQPNQASFAALFWRCHAICCRPLSVGRPCCRGHSSNPSPIPGACAS